MLTSPIINYNTCTIRIYAALHIRLKYLLVHRQFTIYMYRWPEIGQVPFTGITAYTCIYIVFSIEQLKNSYNFFKLPRMRSRSVALRSRKRELHDGNVLRNVNSWTNPICDEISLALTPKYTYWLKTIWVICRPLIAFHVLWINIINSYTCRPYIIE